MLKFSPGEKLDHLFFACTVQEVRIGRGINLKTGEEYPSIELRYGNQEFPYMLKIAQETVRKQQLPTVHLVDSDKSSELVVMFEIRNVSRAFLREMFRGEQPPDTTPDCTFLTAAETEFPWGETKVFHELYREKRVFNLWIAEEGLKPAWAIQLPRFSTDMPSVQRE
ncbi:MAG TPA: hypothetical protein VEC17_02370 [Candidatus Binatia bacterium]|nr:hypothetical protein [Candidatus Binatia bacterium]